MGLYPWGNSIFEFDQDLAWDEMVTRVRAYTVRAGCVSMDGDKEKKGEERNRILSHGLFFPWNPSPISKKIQSDFIQFLCHLTSFDLILLILGYCHNRERGETRSLFSQNIFRDREFPIDKSDFQYVE
jgi:hypothetical protein